MPAPEMNSIHPLRPPMKLAARCGGCVSGRFYPAMAE
jgi:hypothetical protein